MSVIAASLRASVLAGLLATGVDVQQGSHRPDRIAPFLEPQTVAVLGVDLTAFDPQPWIDYLTQLMPDNDRELAYLGHGVQRFRAQLRKHGVEDLYFVFSLGDYPSVHPYYVIPSVDARAAEQLRGLLSAGPQVWEASHQDGTVVIAPRTVIGRIRQLRPTPRPELGEAFRAVAGSPLQLVVSLPAYAQKVIEELLPELPPELGGGPSTTFTRGLRWAALAVDIAPERRVRVIVRAKDAQAARALHAHWKQTVSTYIARPEVAPMLPNPAQAAETLTPKLKGSQLLLELGEQDSGLQTLLAALRAPIESAIETIRRNESMNRLKQLALAMHYYHARHKSFPPVGSRDAQGWPLLSWRVHLLPYLGYGDLYREFHLDEPWDSPHNRKLIPKMPEVFHCPASQLPASKGMSTYRVVSGDATVFPPAKPVSLRDILDGTVTTILIVEVDDAHAVIWTKPEGLPFDPRHPARGLGGQFKGGFHAAFCDGSVRFLGDTIDPKILAALFTRDGREVVRPEELSRPTLIPPRP